MSQQKLSLQEQLLKSGLVSASQAKKIKSEKHKQIKMQRKNHVDIRDDAKELVQKAQEEQLKKDRELNFLRNQQEQQKQLLAQVKQLIEQNRLPLNEEDGVAYHFNEGNKVKTLYVSETMRKQLISGHLAIVKLEKQYDVVSAEVAEKISARNPASVIVHNEQIAEQMDNSDPYAAYQIPDDLMW